MIGLPDCSVTYHKQIAWLEFKRFVPNVGWSSQFKQGLQPAIPFFDIAAESPTQFEMMKRMSEQATFAAYIIWANKTKRIGVWNLTKSRASPEETGITYFERTPEVVAHVAGWLLTP